MKRKLAAWITAVFLVAGCRPADHALRGSPAPDFSLYSLQRDREVSLASLKGQTPILLIFWATWCPPCVEEIPALKEMHSRYEPEKLKIVAINAGEEGGHVAEFAARNNIPYEILLDPEGSAASAYQITGLPVAVLLEKDGEIIYYGFTLPDIEDYFP